MPRKNQEPKDVEEAQEQQEVIAAEETPQEQADSFEQELEQLVVGSGYGQALVKMRNAMLEAHRTPTLLTAADFEPVPAPLKSGALVYVRPTDLFTLVFGGKIPEPMLGVAIKAAEGNYDVTLSDEEAAGMTVEQARAAEIEKARHVTETLNIMAAAVIARPRVVATLDELKEVQDSLKDGEEAPLWAGWLSHEDKLDILSYAQAPVVALRAFRTQ